MAGSSGSRRRRPQGEQPDRSRTGSTGRDSSSTISSRSPNWKRPQTNKVSETTPEVKRRSRKPPPEPPHSSSSNDEEEEDGEQDEDTDQEKAAHRKEDEESIDDSLESDSNLRVVKQNQRNNTYSYNVATSNRQSGTMTSVGIQPGKHRNSLQPTNKAPNAIWNNIENQMQEVKMEKTAVHDFVTNYLFPRLKFMRGTGVNLEYSTEKKSICGLVMAGCHQEHSTDGMRWWGTAKKQTINEIKRLRNDASKNLKISFLGK